jgi:hypothetical protein
LQRKQDKGVFFCTLPHRVKAVMIGDDLFG